MRLLVLLPLLLSACKVSYSTPEEIYSRALKSTVKIVIPGQGGGSGFYVITPKGQKVVVTNAHVCTLPRTPLLVISNRDSSSFTAIPKYISYHRDLCLISAPIEDNHVVFNLAKKPARPGTLAFSAGQPHLAPLTINPQLVIGTWVVTIGYGPEFCQGGVGERKETFFGPVCVRKQRAILIDGVIRPGNSGGALLDRYGDVIGVIYGGNGTQGAAVTLAKLKEVLDLF